MPTSRSDVRNASAIGPGSFASIGASSLCKCSDLCTRTRVQTILTRTGRRTRGSADIPGQTSAIRSSSRREDTTLDAERTRLAEWEERRW
jgi:hypothetical protein